MILTSCEDEVTEPEETEEEYEFTIVEGNFVDPSLINDPITGELILFYLPGIIGSNPAGCPDSDDDGEDDYPCTKYIRSAVTVLSNDSMYVIDGDRVEKEISSGTFSDPDIITDGMGTYFLYVSEGQSVRVYTYGELDNTFEEQGLASDGQGGVPSGIHFGENEFGLFVTTGGGISKGISSDGISFVGPTDSNFTEITIHDDSEERDYADPSIIPWPWNEGDCTTADTSFQYLFAYHYCDSGDCSQPTNHMVGLAGTDNGTDFYPITGFETFAGSVPDIIFHDGAVFMMFTANQSVNWKKFNACFEVDDEGYAYLYE
ncbi:MAG: hypothetical protein QGH61_10260 [Candidatus Marinimicrobia bacterium]|nr:hypothetical protein [Candidatus Neomarinimicrobiota bacterium]